jgi:hypothetical protein
LEVRLLQPTTNARFITLAGFCHGSATVKVQCSVAELLNGEIDQAVGGTAIPALYGRIAFRATAGRDQREIGNTAQIQQGSPARCAAQKCCIGSWY